MIVDAANLTIRLVRGRTKVLTARIGTFASSTFLPTDISLWWFSFTMRTNFTQQMPTVALTYNPIQNLADPTQGQLMWEILYTDTDPLLAGNYVFDVSVTLSDLQPRFFCGGIAGLSDNVTDPVQLPVLV